MTDSNNLARFIDAQAEDYDRALMEIKRGKKTGHWMWYIFPQIDGLGNSETTRFFAIKDIREAEAFLNHPVLGARLIEISSALLNVSTNDPVEILGSIDSLKLKSSITLFSLVDKTNPVFQEVLTKFFDGEKDPVTVRILSTYL